ncbi:hypothetical protein DERP_000139 [Dermatophagoides pteronyssinus]|uniref:Uncharacterized protein n=1 Tax=Dermatophagoides pteronyssinus TaxID=6956 RepID=A0ABQ8IZY6_DERPT|nr:hypothetical protein DERP_000139 [Dermatophagoides pteronyssinus]
MHLESINPLPSKLMTCLIKHTFIQKEYSKCTSFTHRQYCQLERMAHHHAGCLILPHSAKPTYL